MYILAHNPEAILTAIVCGTLLFLILVPLTYFLLCGLSFMLAGIRHTVALTRKLLAPLICTLACFLLLSPALIAGFVLQCATADMPWDKWLLYIGAGLALLPPIPVCRYLLHFAWWRCILATLLIPILHVLLFIGILLGLGQFQKFLTQRNLAPIEQSI